MSAREFYFRTLGRMTDGLSKHSDPMVANGFVRLHNLFRLMDLRTAAGDAPTIDLVRSGFPILREVISVCNDLEDTVEYPRSDRVAELRQEMLDEMLLRRRLPDQRMVNEIARALYRDEMIEMWRNGSTPKDKVFQSDPARSFASGLSPEGKVEACWDFWDGADSRAISVRAVFKVGGGMDVRDELKRVKAAAANFSGVGFSPLSLATEIDESTVSLMLVKLEKLTIGPFISEIFSKVDDPVMDAIRASDDIDDAWAIRWTLDTLVSAGTVMTGGGFFRAARPRQKFVVTVTDPDCAMRSVTRVQRHVAMPHGMFQRLAKRRNECPSLKDAAIHVLSGDRLIENA